MNENFTRYLNIKSEIKKLKKEQNDVLEQDSQYVEFLEEKKSVTEVYNSYKKKRISESPQLGGLEKKICDRKNELKILKDAILDSVNIVITDKETNQQLSLPFNI